MDVDFVKPSLIAIKSIIYHSSTPSNNIRFNLVIPSNTTNIISNMIASILPNFHYRIVEFNPPTSLHQILQKMKCHQIIQKLTCYSTATNYLNYSRYYLHHLFPDLNKIIYIDGDVIVQGDISQLYNTYFSAHEQVFFGAVDGYANPKKYFNYNHSIKLPYPLESYGTYMSHEDLQGAPIESSGKMTKSHFSNRILKDNSNIFNAGIYITLLNQWRTKKIDKVLEEWISKNVSKPNQLLYYCGTEPPLNLVFPENKRLKLDPRWNFIHKWEKFYNKYQKLKYQDAHMIHFKGSKKPWRKECKPKWNKLWHKYETLTLK